jgi:Tol biopolymer transport system component
VTGGYVVLSDPSGIVSAVPFNAGRLEVTGAAVPIADEIGTSTDGDRNLGISASGDFAYQSSVSAGTRLILVDRSGAAREAGADTGLYYAPRLSPDGRRVALTRWTDINFNAQDVWVVDLVQRTRTRLTFDTTASWPVWTPDGRRIAYRRSLAIYWVPADGSGTPESLVTAPGGWRPAAFELGGRALSFQGVPAQQSKVGIWRLGLAGGETPQQILGGAFHNYAPSLSPDGRWLAYVSDESGRFEVYVRPYPGPGGRWQVSLDGGTEPVWSPAGREIFYRNGDRMMAATVRTVGGFEVGGRVRLFEGAYETVAGQVQYTNYDVTRDGRTFVMLQQVQGTAQSLFVTLNWFGQRRGAGSK